MKWLVEISNVPENPRLLEDVLEALSLMLIKGPDSHSLISDKFEVLDNEAEVHALALRVQLSVEEAEKGQPDLKIHFKVRGIIEKLEDGTTKKYGYSSVVESIRLTDSCTAVVSNRVVSESEQQQLHQLAAEQRERDYQILRRKATIHVASAFHDESALKIQRLLRGELNTMNMRHIRDLIQADMGAAISELTPNAQLERFDRSIHHPAVLGMQALHAVSNKEPPPNPMSIDEARAYIRSVAAKWLERKAGL